MPVRKGSSDRKKMTPALKAELNQVNWYAMSQADKKKKAAAAKASTVPGSQRTDARKKAQSKKKMTPALKAELNQVNWYAMSQADKKKKAAGKKVAAKAKRK